MIHIQNKQVTMSTTRHKLTNHAWHGASPCSRQERNSGGTAVDNRLFPGGRPVDLSHRLPVTGYSREIQEVEQRPPTVPKEDQEGIFVRIFKELCGVSFRVRDGRRTFHPTRSWTSTGCAFRVRDCRRTFHRDDQYAGGAGKDLGPWGIGRSSGGWTTNAADGEFVRQVERPRASPRTCARAWTVDAPSRHPVRSVHRGQDV